MRKCRTELSAQAAKLRRLRRVASCIRDAVKCQEPHYEQTPVMRFFSFGPKWGDNHLGLWSESDEPSWFHSLPDEETSTLDQTEVRTSRVASARSPEVSLNAVNS